MKKISWSMLLASLLVMLIAVPVMAERGGWRDPQGRGGAGEWRERRQNMTEEERAERQRQREERLARLQENDPEA